MLKELKKKTSFFKVYSLIMMIILLLNLSSCSFTSGNISSQDLMKDIVAEQVEEREVDNKFINVSTDFAIKLFKENISENKNSLISPLSVSIALTMTANGSNKQTRAQMENLLCGDITLDNFNKYLYTYLNHLPTENKSKINISNSIWFRDDENRLIVEQDFLQKNANYFKADIYKSAFDGKTLKDINTWANKKTEGMIDSILEEINTDDVMYLINAVVFDAKWETEYNKKDITDDIFINIKNENKTVEMMCSKENLYINNQNCKGFIKPYKNNDYKFIALLPAEDLDINEFISGLTGEYFLNLLENAEETLVTAYLPKFSNEYEISMNDSLSEMGIPDAFSPDNADFSKLGKSSYGNIYIGEVLHKTFISVDEAGTKAGAITKVTMKDESAALDEKVVKLNRPFVYAIIDGETNIPIFIGTIVDFN